MVCTYFWSKICSVKTSFVSGKTWWDPSSKYLYVTTHSDELVNLRSRKGILPINLFGVSKKNPNILNLDFVHLFVTKGCIKVKSKCSNPAKYSFSEKFARDYHMNVLTLIQTLPSLSHWPLSFELRNNAVWQKFLICKESNYSS